MDYYHGRRLFANGFKLAEERAEFLRNVHFKAWTHLVTKRRLISKEQFIQVFPEAQYKADLWDNCIDEKGAPKKNP
jgi:hypothetical protein